MSALRTLIAAAALGAAVGALGCDVEDSDPVLDTLTPPPGGVRRLLRREMRASLGEVFGQDIADDLDLPADSPGQRYASQGATRLPLSPRALAQLERAAGQLGQAVLSDETQMATHARCVVAGEPRRPCLDEVIAALGRRLWRRSLDPSEVAELAAVADEGAEALGGDVFGVETAIRLLVQSPDFLYISTLGAPDAERDGHRILTSVELVGRMALFLTDKAPTDAWLAYAEATPELAADSDALTTLAAEMLQTPAARSALAAFFDESLGLDRLATGASEKDRDVFPAWVDGTAAELSRSIHRSIAEVVWSDRSALDLFRFETAWIGPTTAPLFGLNVATHPALLDLDLRPMPNGRRGILGHPAILAVHALPHRTSATKRGLFVQDTLLCNPIDPPPQGVTPVLPPPGGAAGATQRDRLTGLVASPSCRRCHQHLDGVGFALETFDGAGQFRTTDNGEPIDPSGEVPGLGQFDDAQQLAGRLAADPRTADCLVRQLYRHALGHREGAGEATQLAALHHAFVESGYRYQDLLVALVVSPAFRRVGALR